MRIAKASLFFWMMILLGLTTCKDNPNQKRSKIFVVQETSLDDGRSLFWFRDEQDASKGKLSYFQITKDKCELSVENALVNCSLPVQIFNSSGDLIFILAHSSLNVTKTDNRYYFKAVPYSPTIYDSNKNPDPVKQYFLDSVCSPK